MKQQTTFIFLLLSVLLITSCETSPKPTEKKSIHQPTISNPVYIGTYTKKEGHVDGKAQGIYLMHQQTNGSLKMIATAAEATNPSWITLSHDKKYLYAVNELVANESKSGYINAYKVADDYSLTLVDKKSTGAFAPCHIAVDATDTYVITANYVGGVVKEFKKETDGSLTAINTIDLNTLPDQKAEASHAHQITFSKDNKFVYINDLGDDKIWIYKFDETTGKLTPNSQPYISTVKGAGPRHLVIAPNNKFVYGVNELNSTITVYSLNETTGGLTKIQSISTLPDAFTEWNSCAEIAIHPSGKYVYASNRGHNSIAAFKVHKEDGTLEIIDWQSSGGEIPRYFGLDPESENIYVANQNSSNIVKLAIQNDGSLKSTNTQMQVDTPVCIVFYNK